MGRIITFYSYKGGSGRTFALANIAALLARRGKKVLVMDWDLEAPGLDRYYPVTSGMLPAGRGTIHLLREAFRDSKADWRVHISSVLLADTASPGSPAVSLSILPSGAHAPEYGKLVREFSWTAFMKERNGGPILERWREEWSNDFDFVLIDSRTGLTDIGGICTILLPDFLVLVFTANNQSLEGSLAIARGIQLERRSLQVPRPAMPILPLLSRFDGRDEIEEAARWQSRIAGELKLFYDDWVPKGTDPLKVIEVTKIPYISRFSFGEPTPVLTHSITDPELPGFYLENATRLLVSDFADVGKLIGLPSHEEEPATDDPVRVYREAAMLVEKGDLAGWRRLLTKKEAQIGPGIEEWRKRVATNIPQKKPELSIFGLGGLAPYQPLFAVAIAGAESTDERYRNQRRLLYSLRKPAGWDGGGYTVVVSLPDLAAFAFQALTGAVYIHARQSKAAIELATQRTDVSSDSKSVPLFLNHGLIGWPESLNGDASIAWKFLWEMSDAFPWISSSFGSKQAYREALSGYYLVLSWLEFLELAKRGEPIPKQGRLEVPPFFLAHQEHHAAIRLVLEDSEPLRQYSTALGINAKLQADAWPQWIGLCSSWLSAVRRWHFFMANTTDAEQFTKDLFK